MSIVREKHKSLSGEGLGLGWGVGSTCISNGGEYTSLRRWRPFSPNSMHCRKSDSLKIIKICIKLMRIQINLWAPCTHFKESLRHSDSDEGPYAEVSSYRGQEGQHGSHDDPNTKYPPPADPSGQPPTRNLSDEVTEKER